MIAISMISILSGCMRIRSVELSSMNLLSSPNATTSLAWVQASPRNVLSATATWTVSSSSTLTNQKIQFYRDSTCSMPNGAIIDLASSTTNTSVLNGLNGITYSYQVTSINADGGSTVSTCSPAMVFDNASPTVVITGPGGENPAGVGSLTTYTLTFSDSNLGTLSNATINAAITIGGSNPTDCTSTTIGAGATTRTVRITGCSDPAGTANISIGSAAHTDLAGNSLTAAGPSSDLTVDNTAPAAPTIALLSPVNPVGLDTTPSFTLAALEVGASVTLYSDACITNVATSTAAAVSETHTSNAITQGSYTFYAQQTDSVGNVSACSAVGAVYQLSGTPMVSVWRTTGASETITLPPRLGLNYHALVDWGDLSPPSMITSDVDVDLTHMYAVAGDYTITIMGTFEGWCFNQSGDYLKIREVTELGDLNWKSFYRAFYGSSNLTTFNGGVTSGVTNMSTMFGSALNVVPDTSGWDTSSVTDMSSMFNRALVAQPDTSNWNTSQVQDMSYMFYEATANPDTSGWDTSSVINMQAMFLWDTVANPVTTTSGNIWNTSNVTNMNSMFGYSYAANPDTSGWNTANVTDMGGMFYTAIVANPDTSGWNTANVTNMGSMFMNAALANPDTSGWNTLKVTNMGSMFRGAAAAAPVTTTVGNIWNTSAVTDMSAMFYGATIADPDTSGWNTSAVTNMSGMFVYAYNANPDTSNWNTHLVTNFGGMFFSATSANPDTSNWDTHLVTDFSYMFYGATAAQPVTTTSGNIWNTSNVLNMSNMFYGASVANPDTSGWNTSKVTNMEGMFTWAVVANPDTSNWDTHLVTSFGGMFANAFAANPVTTTSGNIWNTSSAVNMSGMFSTATSAYPDTSGWNTSLVTNMGYMFYASPANPDTSGWNTSNVVAMYNMFYGALNANPDMSAWNFGNVTDMSAMFAGVTLPTATYATMLNRIVATSTKTGVVLEAGYSQYGAGGAAARADLLARSPAWIIGDGGF